MHGPSSSVYSGNLGLSYVLDLDSDGIIVGFIWLHMEFLAKFFT